MFNSLVIVYGFEDDCVNIDNTNIISCNTISKSNKKMYCNIIIEEYYVIDIFQIIQIFKKNFYLKLKEMDDFAFSHNKVAKWQLALINKKNIKLIMLKKIRINKQIFYNIDRLKDLIYM
jgi:hypothetical protein